MIVISTPTTSVNKQFSMITCQGSKYDNNNQQLHGNRHTPSQGVNRHTVAMAENVILLLTLIAVNAQLRLHVACCGLRETSEGVRPFPLKFIR